MYGTSPVDLPNALSAVVQCGQNVFNKWLKTLSKLRMASWRRFRAFAPAS